MSPTPPVRRHVFDVEPDFQVPEILGITTAVREVGERDHAELVSTYYDTDDLDMLGSGLTVLRRQGPGGTSWQLRWTGRGTDITVTADGASIPAEIHDLTFGARQGLKLRRVGSLHVDRNTSRALSGSGDLLATVCDDSVRNVRVPGRSAPESWREVVVDVPQDDPSLLEAIEDRLRSAGARSSSSSSKLAHALATDAARHVRTGGPLADALAEQYADVIAGDLNIRLEPEAVEAVLAALRRMRAGLDLCTEALEVSSEPELADHLHEVTAAMSRLLDAKAARAHLTGSGGPAATDVLPLEVLRRIEQRLEAEVDARCRSLVRRMRGHHYLQLLRTLYDATREPQMATALGGLDELHDRIKDQVARDAERAVRCAIDTRSDADVVLAHAAVQRLADLLVLYASAGGTRNHRRLKRLVDARLPVLDRCRDSIATRSLLREAVGTVDGDAFAMGLLYAREEQLTARAVADLVEDIATDDRC